MTQPELTIDKAIEILSDRELCRPREDDEDFGDAILLVLGVIKKLNDRNERLERALENLNEYVGRLARSRD